MSSTPVLEFEADLMLDDMSVSSLSSPPKAEGLRATSSDGGGQTSLFAAAERGDCAAVLELCALVGDIDSNAYDASGHTPCTIAALKGHGACLQARRRVTAGRVCCRGSGSCVIALRARPVLLPRCGFAI
jgi:ankyrin repeat protein